ncbi:MAG TPA: hypothetical protein VE172_13855 [Stackebrandtia sp.]|uniref:hypothetical protein n=1 Tax=Stackebrandtia sp. TaxID=2023065 RepID=UPI002D4D2C6E|nr:hypothetical protein [Stackebrandtia sp.]HZE39887.1 hypothetical protein [Stackebrandtia sp.]
MARNSTARVNSLRAKRVARSGSSLPSAMARRMFACAISSWLRIPDITVAWYSSVVLSRSTLSLTRLSTSARLVLIFSSTSTSSRCWATWRSST